MKHYKFKKHIILILAFVFILNTFNTIAHADTSNVVTLGEDLNSEQRKQILDIFNVKEEDVTIIEVNNQEERRYLEGIASEVQLGKKTISSAYVELLEENSGIDIETYNITWVTKEMYQSALITAGVKDAKIIAAAPFPVSGTGALTGILKAFELATGKEISDAQKKVANEEVFKTGELGQEIGQEKASELIRIIKEEIISKDIKDSEDIKKVIIDIAARLDINLNIDQIKNITNLMEKINKLNLNTEEIKNQLKDIGEKIDKTITNNEQVKSMLEKILDAIMVFFKSLFNQ